MPTVFTWLARDSRWNNRVGVMSEADFEENEDEEPVLTPDAQTVAEFRWLSGYISELTLLQQSCRAWPASRLARASLDASEAILIEREEARNSNRIPRGPADATLDSIGVPENLRGLV